MSKNKPVFRGSCILRIKGIYDSLKSTEKRVADYILHHTDEIVNQTCRKRLAAESSGGNKLSSPRRH
jgi:hypothetical protein